MSLSSLFNLPSAPSQLLTDNSVGSQNSANSAGSSSGSGGDAFASYMAQQMSSGQFANWQNLTSALASQNSLNSQTSDFGAIAQNFTPAPAAWGNNTNLPSQGFGSSSDQSASSNTATDSASDSSNAANTANSSNTSGSAQGANSSSNNSNTVHKKYNHHFAQNGLLNESADQEDANALSNSSGDSSTTSNNSAHQNALYSTSALLMSSGSQIASPNSASEQASADQGKLSASTIKTLLDKRSSTTDGPNAATSGLPIVLPSIGAALLAQQNALNAKDTSTSGTASAGAGTNDLKTVALSSNIELITPTQANTSPQSLISFARSMGLSDPQVHQLFGPQATQATPSATTSGHFASTESLMNSSGALPSAGADVSVSQGVDSSAGLPDSAAPGAVSLSSANSVLSQTSNLQIQIDQAPGANGIQSQATASTLADLNSKVAGLASGAGVGGTGSAVVGAPAATTLEALSVMEASLRPEDVDALQAHFANSPKGSVSVDGSFPSISISADASSVMGGLTNEASGSGFNGSGSDNSSNGSDANSNSDESLGANNLPSDMAAAYEKLSNKFATEVSNRLQQQFAQGQWKMKFALRPSSLGFVDVQLEMKDGKLAANFQSDNALTQSLIQNNSHQLRDALQSSGIAQSSVQVGSGQTSGQGSGQNSGVPYTPVTQAQTSEAQGTEEIATSDDSNQRASSTSSSQLDILA
jgi:flagellar hook-length control protein FliK